MFKYLIALIFFSFLFSSLKAQNNSYNTGELEFTDSLEKSVISTKFKKKDFKIDTLVDLSNKMPPASDQGKQGSCWAWAAAYAMRSWMDFEKNKGYYKADGSLDSSTLYSPAFIYEKYRNRRDEPCNSGALAKLTLNKILQEGAVTFDRFSYRSTDCNRSNDMNSSVLQSAKKNALPGYDVFVVTDLFSAQKKLTDGQPLIISIRLDDQVGDLGRSPRTGKPKIWKNYGDKDQTHAMVCVGYSDKLNAIKVLNSWGKDWGDDGYIWIDYEIAKQSINYYCYPQKTQKNIKVTTDSKAIFELASDSKYLTQPSDDFWFKVGYYVKFENYKIVLADLNKREKTAVVEVREASDYKLIKSLFVNVNTSNEFYIRDKKYEFQFKEIGYRGYNIFKKAVIFDISEI
ncbi:MAG TPA: C1 family peptidase [Pedobacter sp.]|uniref:C1 family peptidase n=1 Tax=Pedobacter sp. TaxID=1411316 RepID=UPI002CBFFA00|nr:C1 family peptidase [Pedobacter sp.]HMI01671.1 C1 family peptidase [Pedobacter sp.]